MVNIAALDFSRLAMSISRKAPSLTTSFRSLESWASAFGGPGAWGAPWFNVQGYSGMGDT